MLYEKELNEILKDMKETQDFLIACQSMITALGKQLETCNKYIEYVHSCIAKNIIPVTFWGGWEQT